MKLPAGATGFGPGTQASHDLNRAFATACHAAARRTGGIVIAAHQAAVTPDFDAVLIAYEHEQVAALRHALLNLAALVQVPGDHVAQPLTFIDRPRLAQVLGETGFQVRNRPPPPGPRPVRDAFQLTRSKGGEAKAGKKGQRT